MSRTLDADGKTSYEQRCVEIIESVTGNRLGDVRGDFETHGFAILRSALQPGHVSTLYTRSVRVTEGEYSRYTNRYCQRRAVRGGREES
jgi:hypothetical protein